MAKGRSENRNGKGRRDFARFLLMVLPGFMFVGLLAPAAVTVKPKAEPRYEAVSFRDFAPRKPIHLTRMAASASSPVMDVPVAVEPLFSGARYAAIDMPREMPLPPVDAGTSTDGEIVLAQDDSGDDYVSDTMFDQSVDSPVLAVDLTPLWDPAIFDRIPGTISKGGYTQYDDFHGNGIRFLRGAPGSVPIPEPRTGALVALGLLALAMRARSRD